MLSNSRDEWEKLDPRVRRTRQMLEQAFLDVIQEKGFQAVTVQDITTKAGVNRATFYAHFADKFALLDYNIRHRFRQEIEKRMLNACHYSDENLQALIATVCEFVSNTNSHCTPSQPQFESLVEAQVKSQLQGLLQLWLEQVVSDIDPEMAATATSWAIYGLALQWSRNKKSRSPEEFAREVHPLVAGNLRLVEHA